MDLYITWIIQNVMLCTYNTKTAINKCTTCRNQCSSDQHEFICFQTKTDMTTQTPLRSHNTATSFLGKQTNETREWSTEVPILAVISTLMFMHSNNIKHNKCNHAIPRLFSSSANRWSNTYDKWWQKRILTTESNAMRNALVNPM